MGVKRFQDCNRLVKIWRFRHYIPVPFKWFWFQYVRSFVVIGGKTSEVCRVKGSILWKLLIGIAQAKMSWYWTQEEVKRFN